MKIKKEDIQNILPLSPMQEGMLYYSIRGGENSAYFEQMNFEVEGEFCFNSFQTAAELLIKNNDILRTVFIYEKVKRPIQVILKNISNDITFEDLSEGVDAGTASIIGNYILNDRENKFNLSQPPLLRIKVFKLTSKKHKIILSFPHIIMDGWCLGALQEELFSFYSAAAAGGNITIKPKAQYSSYIEWLEKRDKNAELIFWEKYLSGFEKPVFICANQASNKNDYSLKQHRIRLDRNIFIGLKDYLNKNGFTFQPFIFAVWGILIGRYTNTRDIIFGSTVSGRNLPVKDIEKIIGLFINTIPIRIRFSGAMRFSAFLKTISAECADLKKFECCPLADIQTRSLKGALFDHLFIDQGYLYDNTAAEENNYKLKFSSGELYEHTEYNLVVTSTLGNDCEFLFNWNANIFDEPYILKMQERLFNIIEKIVETPDVEIRRLPFIENIESSYLTGKKVEVNPATALDMFYKQATDNKYGIAAVYKETRLTFEQVNQRAAILAEKIYSKFMPEKNNIIGIMLEPSSDILISIIAVWKLGCFYLPLDPNNPEERLKYIINDSCPACVLTYKNNEQFDYPVFFIDDSVYSDFDEKKLKYEFTNLCDAAYIIYTTGTTGRPKGVQLSQRNLANYIQWFGDYYSVRQKDSSILLASYAFDLGYTSLFGVVMNGGCIHFIDEANRRDFYELADYISKNEITVLKMTPSMFGGLIAINDVIFKSEKISLILLGGEELQKKEIEKFYRLNKTAVIANHYGPTETTIGSISIQLDENTLSKCSEGAPVIGKPVFNTEIYILDDDLNPVPENVAGEIYIGGAGLSLGYLRNDGLTEQKFITHPVNGTQIYKTGDSGKICDGLVYFHGRSGSFIKIRGYRVEPLEIESAILKNEKIFEAAVVLKKNALNSENDLAVYYKAAAELSSEEIRNFLKKYIPEYMIPRYFFKLEIMPLTPNGKLDRNYLAALEIEKNDIIADRKIELPADEAEKKLAAIFSEILTLSEIGVNDDFFQLGGHSIKAVYAVSSINKEFKTSLKIRDIFENTKISELKKLIMSSDNLENQRDYIILKKAGNNHKNYFFMPPVSGTSLIYKQMIDASDEKINAYGFQCRGFDSDRKFFENITEMSENFSEEIIMIQKTEIINIVGYSMGGLVALKVAEILEKKGFRTRLMLIDCSPFVEDFKEYLTDGLEDFSDFEKFKNIFLESETELKNSMPRLINLVKKNVELIKKFAVTAKLNSDIYAVQAGGNQVTAGMERIKNLTIGSFYFIEIPGEHYEIFEHENIKNIALEFCAFTDWNSDMN